MSQIQLFNDTGHIRNQRLPVGAVVGDLLYWDNTGWNLRTSVTQQINGYVAVLDAGTDTGVICISNGMTTWKGGNAPGNIIYEDTTNPAKVTIATGGKRIGVIKGAVGGVSLQYEGDSFFIDCFDNNEGDANNGLSIKNGTTVLGQDVGAAGDPAKLTSKRQVPMYGHDIEYVAGNGDKTILYGSNGDFETGGQVMSNNQQRNHDIGQFQNQGFLADGSGLRTVHDVGKNVNANLLGTIYESAMRDYPENVGGGIAAYQKWLSSQRKRIGAVWQHSVALFSGNGRYFFGNGGPAEEYGASPIDTGTLPLILDTDKTQILTVESNTGQIGRLSTLSGTLQTTVSSGTTAPFVDFTTASFTLNLTKTCKLQFNYRHNFSTSINGYYQVKLFEGATNLVPSFIESTGYVVTNANQDEQVIARSYSIDLPAGVHNLDVKVATSDVVSLQDQGLVDILYVL